MLLLKIHFGKLISPRKEQHIGKRLKDIKILTTFQFYTGSPLHKSMCI